MTKNCQHVFVILFYCIQYNAIYAVWMWNGVLLGYKWFEFLLPFTVWNPKTRKIYKIKNNLHWIVMFTSVEFNFPWTPLASHWYTPDFLRSSVILMTGLFLTSSCPSLYQVASHGGLQFDEQFRGIVMEVSSFSIMSTETGSFFLKTLTVLGPSAR